MTGVYLLTFALLAIYEFFLAWRLYHLTRELYVLRNYVREANAKINLTLLKLERRQRDIDE